MRNEAKLNVFKQAARLGNFKNIAFSIASRHQRLLCYELSTSKLVNSPMVCGPCNQFILNQETLKKLFSPVSAFKLQLCDPHGLKLKVELSRNQLTSSLEMMAYIPHLVK